MSWEMVRLGDLAESVENWNPLQTITVDTFNYIDIGSVNYEIKEITGAKLTECKTAPSRAKQLVKTNDILVSTVRPNLNAVAKVSPQFNKSTASTGFCVIRCNSKILDNSFLFNWVKSSYFINEMISKATGASYPAVSDKIIFNSLIPLPPISEQKRIAAILDKADEIRRKREQAITKLEQLAQSIFVEMFGDNQKYTNRSLQSICEVITDGTHYTPTYADEGFIFLSAKNVTSGTVDWEKVKYVGMDLHNELQKRISPKIGDVLMAKNGTTGVAAIVDRDVVFDIYVSLALLRPSKLILSRYLHAALNSPLAKRQFNAALKGIGVPNLHLVDIRKTLIPLPPIALQEEFAKRINQIEKLKADNTEALANHNALFASLQQQAFSGNL
jgi:type I restriction enzyme S subunit